MKVVWLLILGCVVLVGSYALWMRQRPYVAIPWHASIPSGQGLDLSGRPVDPFQGADSRPLVFVFLSVDCPISNSYAPEVRRIAAEFGPRGVVFRLVYPNPDEDPETIRKHLGDYGYSLQAIRDPRHELTKAAAVTVTPEVSVFVPGRGFVYHGRIDDRHVAFGKARIAPTRHDLRDALTAVLEGRPVSQPATRAIGCYISDVP